MRGMGGRYAEGGRGWGVFGGCWELPVVLQNDLLCRSGTVQIWKLSYKMGCTGGVAFQRGRNGLYCGQQSIPSRNEAPELMQAVSNLGLLSAFRAKHALRTCNQRENCVLVCVQGGVSCHPWGTKLVVQATKCRMWNACGTCSAVPRCAKSKQETGEAIFCSTMVIFCC